MVLPEAVYDYFLFEFFLNKSDDRSYLLWQPFRLQWSVS